MRIFAGRVEDIKELHFLEVRSYVETANRDQIAVGYSRPAYEKKERVCAFVKEPRGLFREGIIRAATDDATEVRMQTGDPNLNYAAKARFISKEADPTKIVRTSHGKFAYEGIPIRDLHVGKSELARVDY